MTEKMTVLYVKETGHVLAALTRVAAPGGKITQEDVVGQGLPFRVADLGAILQFNVPVNDLEMLVVDLDTDLLLWYSQYSADEQQKTINIINRPASNFTVTLVSSQVTVLLGTEVLNTTAKIRVQIEGGGLASSLNILGEATVTPNQATDATGPLSAILQFPTNLLSGDYRLLILAAGYRPQVLIVNIPP